MKNKRTGLLLLLLIAFSCGLPFREKLRRPVVAAIQLFQIQKTTADRIDEFEAAARSRLAPDFHRVGIPYPPARIILVGLKKGRRLEVWVSRKNGAPKLLKSYPILGASGRLGPKLAEGDLQVPEGLYRVESLHPNSMFHLALRVNYPNAFDRAKGLLDGRGDLGSDIMIHGKTSSMGCLAMGDEAVEELFILAALTGIENISIILSPVDFRRYSLPENMPTVPDWTFQLYAQIRKQLRRLKNADGVQSSSNVSAN